MNQNLAPHAMPRTTKIIFAVVFSVMLVVPQALDWFVDVPLDTTLGVQFVLFLLAVPVALWRGLVDKAARHPQFQHDCDKCTFLGRHGDNDLYFCGQEGFTSNPTVIARYSSEPSHYQSGLPGADVIEELAEAKRRAIAVGLLPQTQGSEPMPEDKKVVFEHAEYREAVKVESDRLLQIIAEATGMPGVEDAMVTTQSLVGHFIDPMDLETAAERDAQLEKVSKAVGFQVNYSDTLVSVARRMRPGGSL